MVGVGAGDGVLAKSMYDTLAGGCFFDALAHTGVNRDNLFIGKEVLCSTVIHHLIRFRVLYNAIALHACCEVLLRRKHSSLYTHVHAWPSKLVQPTAQEHLQQAAQQL